jgi:hypothetical protein
MTRIEEGHKRGGAGVVRGGRIAPTALAQVMGDQAPGPKVHAVRLRTGGKIYGGTTRGLVRVGAQGAAVVGGVAAMGHGLTTLGRMSNEVRRKRAQQRAGVAKALTQDQARRVMVGLNVATNALPVAYVGGQVAQASYLGHDPKRISRKGMKSYEKENKRYLGRVESDRRYKPAGNDVYVRNRRFGRKTSDQYVRQAVEENKGSGKKVYLRMRYPNPLSGYKALTFGGEK